MDKKTQTIPAMQYLIGAIIFGAIFYIYTFSQAMLAPLNQDENQFIASAYLLSSKSLLPYIDYPYFHVPNLVFVYAGLFRIFGHPFFIARSFSAVCAALSLGLISSVAYQRVSCTRVSSKIGFALGSGLFLIANPLFQYTSGKAWNHDLPVLLILAAGSILLFSENWIRPRVWLLVSGFLIGWAAGTRAAYVLAVLAFVVYVWIHNKESARSDRIKNVAVLLGGIAIGLLPTIYLLISNAPNFVFGNLEYARLNTQYRLNTNFGGDFTLSEKLAFFVREILSSPATATILLAFFIICIPKLWSSPSAPTEREKGIFWISLVLLLIIAGFLPSPMFRQYLYAPIPIMYFAIIFYISDGIPAWRKLEPIQLFIAALVAVVAISGLQNLPLMTKKVVDVENWVPYQVRRVGKSLSAELPQGNVLTLAPVYVTEAGLDIYPEFAMGSFAFRVSGFLGAEERKRFKMISPEDLGTFLENNPPVAILTFVDVDKKALNDILARQAQLLGFTGHALEDGLEYWSADADIK
jgi:hypothetical protein